MAKKILFIGAGAIGSDRGAFLPGEIDSMNGRVVAQGRERGIATPVSAAVVDIVRDVEAGLRQPAPPSIEGALRRAGR